MLSFGASLQRVSVSVSFLLLLRTIGRRREKKKMVIMVKRTKEKTEIKETKDSRIMEGSKM